MLPQYRCCCSPGRSQARSPSRWLCWRPRRDLLPRPRRDRHRQRLNPAARNAGMRVGCLHPNAAALVYRREDKGPCATARATRWLVGDRAPVQPLLLVLVLMLRRGWKTQGVLLGRWRRKGAMGRKRVAHLGSYCSRCVEASSARTRCGYGSFGGKSHARGGPTLASGEWWRRGVSMRIGNELSFRR